MIDTTLITTEVQAVCDKCNQVHTAYLQGMDDAVDIECCGKTVRIQNYNSTAFEAVTIH